MGAVTYLPPAEDEDGLTYAGLIIAADAVEPVRDALAAARFSGYLGPVERPGDRAWLVAVAHNPTGAVAGDRQDVARLVARVADELGTLVVGATVLRDRVLRLVWDGPDTGAYDSDPSFGRHDDDLDTDPVGVSALAGLAEACGRADSAEDLIGLLGERIDTDGTYESERLRAALRLLAMPAWLVAADSLPRDVPGGPPRQDVVRLRAGATGAVGLTKGTVVGAVRRRRRLPRS